MRLNSVSVYLLVSLFSGVLLGAEYKSIEAERFVTGDLCSESNPDFDGYRYEEKIPHCQRNVSIEMKRRVARKFGINSDFHLYQIDHYYPLSMGGSNSEKNLWPLPVPEAKLKGVLELETFERLQAGEISRSQALDTIRKWRRLIEQF